MIAMLSSKIRNSTLRPKIVSKRSRIGNASENEEHAKEIVSASVVDLEVQPCRLDTHAIRNHVFGLTQTKNPPDADLVEPESPEKSASTTSNCFNLSVLSLTLPHNL